MSVNVFYGTRANRLSNPPVSISPGLPAVFHETDTKVMYVSGDGYGTGNLNNNVFTMIGPAFGSGRFYSALAGQTIVINGVSHTILSATSTTVTIASTGLVQSGVSWSIANSYWFYAGGFETVSLATLFGRSMEPTDDQYNAYIYDYGHSVSYNGTSGLWGWGLSDSGSNYQVVGNSGPPKGGVWATCNGAQTTVFDITSGVLTFATVNTPNNPGSYLRR